MKFEGKFKKKKARIFAFNTEKNIFIIELTWWKNLVKVKKKVSIKKVNISKFLTKNCKVGF